MTNGESEQQVPQRPRSAQPAEATMRKIVRRRAETNKARRNNNPNRKNERERRELGGSQSEDEEFYSEYFEDYDADGDAYSLAWRYLGVYIDTEDDDAPYSRKVLWAAYYDPYYGGNQIGEYAYYDWLTQTWDNSTCVSGSTCAKMNCHTTNTTETTWQLIGIYKESLEFENDTFFEQLFKHQGVCLWDTQQSGDGTSSSAYQFMQTMREQDMDQYATSCYQLDSGLYIGAKPVMGGNLTLAVYSDTYCMTELSSDTYPIENYLGSKTSSGKTWTQAFSVWDEMMAAYKVCQPCRAYSKYYNNQTDWSQDDHHRDRDRRALYEFNDGQGAAEVNGYNCYDDAGYRNCNQCFKFETHTDMEEASMEDLKLATNQGTIVPIDVDGERFGGHYTTYYTYQASNSYSSGSDTSGSDSSADGGGTVSYYGAYSSVGVAGLALAVVTGFVAQYRRTSRQTHQRRPSVRNPTEQHEEAAATPYRTFLS